MKKFILALALTLPVIAQADICSDTVSAMVKSYNSEKFCGVQNRNVFALLKESYAIRGCNKQPKALQDRWSYDAKREVSAMVDKYGHDETCFILNQTYETAVNIGRVRY
jgi:hypothetical protein